MEPETPFLGYRVHHKSCHSTNFSPRTHEVWHGFWHCGSVYAWTSALFPQKELLQYIGEVLRGFDNLKVNTSYFWTFGYLSQPWIVSREGRSSHQQKLAEHGYWPATNCKENAISLRHHATTYSVQQIKCTPSTEKM